VVKKGDRKDNGTVWSNFVKGDVQAGTKGWHARGGERTADEVGGLTRQQVMKMDVIQGRDFEHGTTIPDTSQPSPLTLMGSPG